MFCGQGEIHGLNLKMTPKERKRKAPVNTDDAGEVFSPKEDKKIAKSKSQVGEEATSDKPKEKVDEELNAQTDEEPNAVEGFSPDALKEDASVVNMETQDHAEANKQTEQPIAYYPPSQYPYGQYPYFYGQYPQYPSHPHYQNYPSTQYPASSAPYNPVQQDPEQEYYMSLYSHQSAVTTPASGMLYEQRRSQNQMNHYFDLNKFSMSLPGHVVQQEQLQKQTKKVSKAELEFFKKRKEEKKQMKNKWLFE